MLKKYGFWRMVGMIYIIHFKRIMFTINKNNSICRRLLHHEMLINWPFLNELNKMSKKCGRFVDDSIDRAS